MRWLQWFGDHVGLALVGATVWLLVVAGVYVGWVVWGGWDRESDLALAEALAPVAGAGFAFVVVSAAVLAFRPPRPELSCVVRDILSRRGALNDGPRLTIVNSGSLPASDVTIELEGAPFGDNLRVISPFWQVTTKDARIEHLDDRADSFVERDPHSLPYRTVIERSRPFPNSSSEIVFFGRPSLPPPSDLAGGVSIRVTASNAAAVSYEPSRHDWDEWYVADMLTSHTLREQLEFHIRADVDEGERTRLLRCWLVREVFVRYKLVRWRLFGGCPYSTRPMSKPVSDLTDEDIRP